MAVTVADDLVAFMETLHGQPVEWGVNDCSAAPHAWLKRRGIEARLPRYGSRDEAHAIIAEHGSLAAAWEWCLDGTGLVERYGEPEMGDIAVIDTRLFGGQIGGIIVRGNVMAVRRDDGSFSPFPARRFAKVWAVT